MLSFNCSFNQIFPLRDSIIVLDKLNEADYIKISNCPLWPSLVVKQQNHEIF